MQMIKKEYGPYETHISTNFTSPFAPSIQLTCLPQDGVMKSCDDQSVFFHTPFGIPHRILYFCQ
jgi:hypothetical protein